MSSRDAMVGVLERETFGRRQTEALGGDEEGVGRGLGIGYIVAAYDDREVFQQTDVAEVAFHRRTPRRCGNGLRDAFVGQVSHQFACARTQRNALASATATLPS